MALVPEGFVVPTTLVTAEFRLEPLGPQHNDSDYAAWMGSIAHIKSTPGFADWDWPDESLTLDDNRRDLVEHAGDFDARTGFTYSVLDLDSGESIGCVYLYPSKREGYDVSARSWVTAQRADLDVPLWLAVSAWLAEDWPFEAPLYAPR
jgi:hypothetical protein